MSLHIQIDDKSKTPVFLQVANVIERSIQNGVLIPGEKLPTVRALAQETSIAQGTIKHAYDWLEEKGLINKTQGRGTFVNDSKGEKGRKDRAMDALDACIREMEALSFGYREMRIFFDLKLREREGKRRPVRICVVECSPETLAIAIDQLSKLSYAEVYGCLVDEISSTRDMMYDLWITTPMHTEEVREMAETLPMRMVLVLSSKTITEVSRIKTNEKIGILCESSRFSHVIKKGLQQYGPPGVSIDEAVFGSIPEGFFAQINRVILPAQFEKYASPEELDAINQCEVLVYRYRIDKGSYLYLEEAIKDLHNRINN